MVQSQKRSCGTVAGLNYVDSMVLQENVVLRVPSSVGITECKDVNRHVKIFHRGSY